MLSTVTRENVVACVVVCIGEDNTLTEAFRKEREQNLHVNKGFNGAVNH